MKKFFTQIVVFVLATFTILPTTFATTYHTGPKGGCYYYSSSGHKNYVSHYYCGHSDDSVSSVKNYGNTYYTGPKGGCFYYGANYKKIYVAHSYCGN